MNIKVSVKSKQLDKEELRLLIQGIRTCEQTSFPEKEISIWIEVPELTQAECEEILASIKPPYKYGPVIIDKDKMDLFTLSVNAFEAGVLHGIIMQQEEHQRQLLSRVEKQLVDLKKQIEQELGVKKEILPGGMLRITDRDGNVITRPPYSWEIEGN